MAKRFTLKRKEVPVEIEEADGTVRNYVLKELRGDQRDEFVNMTAGRMRVGQDGKPQGMRDVAGIQAKLVSMSLHDPDGKEVPTDAVNKWPASTQQGLFEEASALSGLAPKSEDEAKND